MKNEEDNDQLPPNFEPYLEQINYYRHTLKLDCLSTAKERARFFVGYHVTKRNDNVGFRWYDANHSDFYLIYGSGQVEISWVSCKRYANGRHLLNPQAVLNSLENLISPQEIECYLRDIYPSRDLVPVKRDDTNCKQVFIANRTNENVIRLYKYKFKMYCNYYNDVVRTYKGFVHSGGGTFKLPQTPLCLPGNYEFSSNTAECVEKLINHGDTSAYKNVTNLGEYIKVIEFLDVSFK
jgi:hypothetical protein